MASSTSSDLKLELITTGEKSGTWGTITNTNLQILEQAASGYISVDVASSDVALALSNHAVSNGKNLYFKLTGTLAANRTVTMPDSAERVFIVEDATTRSTSNFTLTIKTVSGTGIALPVGSKCLVYSDGTNINRVDLSSLGGEIATASIADNAITTAKISDNQITTVKVSDLAITTAKISNNAITSDKLLRKFTITTNITPAGGADGDLWFVYS